MWAKTKRWRRTHPHRPLCTFAHVEGVCDTPLQFYVITRWCKNALKQLQTPIVHCAKTAWSHFMPKLFTVQDHFYIVQGPFVHDAKPSCKCSKSFCPLCKTSMQMFRTSLFMIQTYIALFSLHFSVNGLIHDLSGDAQTPCATSIYLCISYRNISEIAKYFLSAFVCKITMPLSR